MKKEDLNYDDCDSVNSDDYKDFATLYKQKRKLRKNLTDDSKKDDKSEKLAINEENDDKSNNE